MVSARKTIENQHIMRNPPYIPTQDQPLAEWASNFSNLLTASPATYGLTAGDATAVASAVGAYTTALTTVLTPETKTPPAVAAKNEARADMLAIVQPKAVLISGNASVSAENKTAIGVTVRSSVRTPVVAPTVAPLLSVDSVNTNTVRLRYANAETPTSKAAPLGCGGVELVAVYGATPTPDVNNASPIGALTKSPGVISTAGHTGEMITIWARWRTKNGIQGGVVGYSPWSTPVTVVAN